MSADCTRTSRLDALHLARKAVYICVYEEYFLNLWHVKLTTNYGNKQDNLCILFVSVELCCCL